MVWYGSASRSGNGSGSGISFKLNKKIIQPVPKLPSHRKQACADSKRDSKMIKINFPVAHITEL
jgi:hypothetical protein